MRGRLGLLVAAAIVTAGVITAAAWPDRHDPSATASQNAATADVLGRGPAAGKLCLLVFLATQPDTADTPSHSQAVDLVSLQTQYGHKGLDTRIVDESGASRDTLINTYYDWHLGDVRLTADPARALARQYGVTSTPTAVLLDAAGTTIKRWDTPVHTMQAAQVIAGELAS